ncbi:MAG: hypothetical protein AB7R90_19890 [Reyranellaceae bacterium]
MDKLAIWLTGLVMAVLSILGLKLAADAADIGIAIFGSGLFVFGMLFIFGLLKKFADRFYEGQES